jgi:hypothetical protein
MRKKWKMMLSLMYSSMDQRSICLFLAMKRLSAQAISGELVAVLGPRETPPEMARYTIQDRKIMVTIA